MWFWEEISAALLMPPSWLCPVFWILASFPQTGCQETDRGMYGMTGGLWVATELLEWRLETCFVKLKKRSVLPDSRLNVK